jgi:monothiol bacilliredoxin
MFWNKPKEKEVEVEWFQLTSIDQLDEIIEESSEKGILIYKHSTRCGVSSMAMDRLMRTWDVEHSDNIKAYFLDLIAFREVSNEVANRFGIYHQSPQVLLIKNGNAIYEASHMAISFSAIKAKL